MNILLPFCIQISLIAQREGLYTTHALIKLTDEWFKASDNSDNFIRILFLDFSKAFDLINHDVLLQKFLDYNFPPHITVWSLALLQDREQFVSIGNINSTILKSNAGTGTPQGTITRPNDFKLLINDLQFDINYIMMTSQYRRSLLTQQTVHCNQQLI